MPPVVCLLLIFAFVFFVKSSLLFAKDKETIITEALDAIANAQNAEKHLDLPANTADNSEIREEVTKVEYETKVFSLRHIRVADIKTEIEDLLSPDTGSAVYDEALNQLTVADIPENLEAIATKVAELDKKTEIAFVGQIVQILLNEEHRQGIDWEAIVSHYQPINFRPQGSAVSAELGLGTISQEDFKVLFGALEAAGKVETIGQPSVTVKPYQEAGIPLALTRPFELLISTDTNAKTLKNPTIAEFFLELLLTPAWPENNSLSLDLNPQFHWISDAGPQKRPLEDPTVTVSRVDAVNTTVAPADMLVIGGLFQTKEVSIETKVPVVGNLPVLGSFFRVRRPSIEKTEFVIFLTPKIMVEEPSMAENPL